MRKGKDPDPVPDSDSQHWEPEHNFKNNPGPHKTLPEKQGYRRHRRRCRNLRLCRRRFPPRLNPDWECRTVAGRAAWPPRRRGVRRSGSPSPPTRTGSSPPLRPVPKGEMNRNVIRFASFSRAQTKKWYDFLPSFFKVIFASKRNEKKTTLFSIQKKTSEQEKHAKQVKNPFFRFQSNRFLLWFL